ncbi:PREDICTED: DNA repair protein complementing XP-C cells homolog [Nicrophorus vespilloides]|uniref:DNA repair protein complementing XP-C cells homolog n=1 Tax=Nicrophorus vespilloides TaxID=110193 RepID=A0ABM1MQG5_NICVS|nr:PREDICTED: DNA repair protein complementing XP-C cells homolog [Nicrophorus vespilloides]
MGKSSDSEDSTDLEEELDTVENNDSSDDPDVVLRSGNSRKSSGKRVTRQSVPEKSRVKSSDSSSESDIENYLTKPGELNLNSTFFKSTPNDDVPKSFGDIENAIFNGVNRLSDSESDEEEMQDEEAKTESETAKTEMVMNFQQLNEYTKKIEEAKKHLELYHARKKQKKELKVDIGDLLAIGEKTVSSSNAQISMHSTDFESLSESEKEDWEEVAEEKEAQRSLIPKEGVQITVQMPELMKKKKGVDLLAAMKRRLNQIKKENQIYIHKVHLLTWLAHGNFINEVLNRESLLAMSLSLLPSQQCYPSERTDLKYLEQILAWYRKNVKIVEKDTKNLSLEKSLQQQIDRREAHNKKMFVYLFICILRSLGIHCRLVLSLQVEPLKPPASELCSLSTKEDQKVCPNTDDADKVKKQNKSSGLEKTENVANKKGNETKNKRKSVNDEDASTSTIIKKSKSEDQLDDTKKSKNVVKKKEATVENKSVKDNNKSTVSTLQKGKSKKKIENLQEASSTKVTDKKTNTSDIIAKNQRKSSKINIVDTSEVEMKELDVGNKSKKKVTKKSLEASKKSKTDTQKLEQDESTSIKSDKLKEPKTTKINLKKLKVGGEDKQGTDKSSTVRKTRSAKSKTMKIDVNNLFKSTKKKTEKLEEKNEMEQDIDKLISNMENLEKVVQLDGCGEDTSDEECSNIPQLDGGIDEPTNKPNLKKLKNYKMIPCPTKDRCQRRLALEKTQDLDQQEAGTSRNPFSPKNVTTPFDFNTQKEVKLKPINKRRNCVDAEKKTTTESKSYSECTQYFKNNEIKDDIIKLVKKSVREEKMAERLRKVKKSYVEESDSDFASEPVIKKKKNSDVKVKRRVLPKQQLKEQEEKAKTEKETKKQKIGLDIWIEVFLEAEEKWISADVVNGKIHCVKDLHNQASHPVSYILSWDNSNRIKDVTKRYCANWNTVTRKLRAEPKWWEESLRPFIGKKNYRDKEEDEDLARQQLDQPLPKTISEYKDHPLYVLKRHLLKFQAIYPPDSLTLGFVRGEPVYSRDCVYVLHSRDIWLKSAKVVKLGETPYKIVKARPKYDKLSNSMITDQPLEIFGHWQTEDYVPPTAENGVVPRNAYGNVELFKPCMLPKKTVHLQLPGLNKVARKLNIDCAPAVVGFDFHSGGTHPMFDGFIVCEEEQERLIAAWYVEQEEAEKREKEKYEKRVFGNWRKLIRGLLIRERLKRRYDFGDPNSKKIEKKPPKPKGPRFLTKHR